MKSLTGGPLGPMIERPGSPGAPYRQKERQDENHEKHRTERGLCLLPQSPLHILLEKLSILILNQSQVKSSLYCHTMIHSTT